MAADAILVGIVMGSRSDWETMAHAAATLSALGIGHETKVVSAHRTPKRLYAYAEAASARGIKLIIAGAGGAAHLPGMIASLSALPVLGVPVESRALKGLDSLLSIVQMPAGVPVATFAIGKAGAVNAALFAASVLALSDRRTAARLNAYRASQTKGVPIDPVASSAAAVSAGSVMSASGPIAPGKTIGILGGGQLGRMAALAAARLGYRCHIYCPESEAPAFHAAAARTVAPYDDEAALSSFAEAVDVITLEFENIPVATAEYLSARRPFRPGPRVLSIAQDRLREKDYLGSISVPTTRYLEVSRAEALERAVREIGRPCVLKSSRFGYDGKGQIRIEADTNLKSAWKTMGSDLGILEAFVDFALEISVIVARNPDGHIAVFVPVENQHRNHILDTTIAPARISDRVAMRAEAIARHIADELKLEGLLAVEMFVTGDEEVLVNEMAPRPHNSGHWTIDACITSQFEQFIRAVAGLPLGSTERHSDAVMKNLLGNEVDGWLEILSEPAAKLHLYGKGEARPGRKMGHVTRLQPRRDG